jgi:hypothetical protein
VNNISTTMMEPTQQYDQYARRPPWKDPYDDETASLGSCDSDSSTLRALKTTIEQFNAILKDLDIKPSSLEEDVDDDYEYFPALDESRRILREELYAVDRQELGSQLRSRRHPQIQIQVRPQEEPTDNCWDFFGKLIPSWFRPRAFCDPFEDELHYLFVGMDGRDSRFL